MTASTLGHRVFTFILILFVIILTLTSTGLAWFSYTLKQNNTALSQKVDTLRNDLADKKAFPTIDSTKDPYLQVTLERHASCTRPELCPGYSLSIFGNGQATYNGKKNVKTKGIRNLTVPVASFNESISDLNQIHFFSLPKDYMQGFDIPSATLTVSFNGISKTTTFPTQSEDQTVIQLNNIANKIDAGVNTAPLIK